VAHDELLSAGLGLATYVPTNSKVDAMRRPSGIAVEVTVGAVPGFADHAQTL
jgi:hypothetical protein